MRARTQSLLSSLAGQFYCAVISGRALSDLKKRLSSIEPLEIVGNHGIEWKIRTPLNQPKEIRAFKKRVKQWHSKLSALQDQSGIFIENKGLSISVHISRGNQATTVNKMLKEITGVRLIGGKKVFNLIPKQAPNKGDALRYLLRLSKCESALFVGDDITDEDAFIERHNLPMLTIRIGNKKGSAAEFFIPTQKDLDELLRFLLKTATTAPQAGYLPTSAARSITRVE